MTLEIEINRIQQLLREGRFTNEAEVKQGIVLPILQALDWPISDINIVIPEYSVAGRRVDYALCPPLTEQAKVFIEAKAVGNIEGGDQQLFEYAFHQGVPLLVLTDGKEWNFYLPSEPGNYQERKVYKIDLLERDPNTSKEKFYRYLQFSRVSQNQALEDARKDLRELTTRNVAERNISRAWQAILREHNDILMELLIERVEDMCGIRPESLACENFIDSLLTNNPRPEITPTPQRNNIREGTNRITQNQIGYKFFGKSYHMQYARDVMIDIIKRLAERDSTFLTRFETRARGRTRNYIARNKMDLYPGRNDLCENESREIVSGWWIGVNLNKLTIDKILRIALEVAQITKGQDVDYYLGV